MEQEGCWSRRYKNRHEITYIGELMWISRLKSLLEIHGCSNNIPIINPFSQEFHPFNFATISILSRSISDVPHNFHSRHWIRSRHWDQFRNWVQTETQRCCAGQVDQAEVSSFQFPVAGDTKDELKMTVTYLPPQKNASQNCLRWQFSFGILLAALHSPLMHRCNRLKGRWNSTIQGSRTWHWWQEASMLWAPWCKSVKSLRASWLPPVVRSFTDSNCRCF